MNPPVIRISLGKFAPELAETIEAKLNESRARLEPGIRALKGNLGYFVGLDRLNNAMHNVSFWETVDDAEQMASFAPMLALGAEFAELGVRFERPILNCATIWRF